MGTLEEVAKAPVMGRKGGWDQFSTFETMTGKTTSYTDEAYTTKLDMNDPQVRAKMAEAKRIAREIEGQGTSNMHMAEERGLKVDDSGMDEEDKYSGVLQQAKPVAAAGKPAANAGAAAPSVAGGQGAADGKAAPAAKKPANSSGLKSSLSATAKPFQLRATAKAFVPFKKNTPPAAPAAQSHPTEMPGVMPQAAFPAAAGVMPGMMMPQPAAPMAYPGMAGYPAVPMGYPGVAYPQQVQVPGMQGAGAAAARTLPPAAPAAAAAAAAAEPGKAGAGGGSN